MKDSVLQVSVPALEEHFKVRPPSSPPQKKNKKNNLATNHPLTTLHQITTGQRHRPHRPLPIYLHPPEKERPAAVRHHQQRRGQAPRRRYRAPVRCAAYGVTKAGLNWATRKIHFENDWLGAHSSSLPYLLSLSHSHNIYNTTTYHTTVSFPLHPGPVDTDMCTYSPIPPHP